MRGAMVTLGAAVVSGVGFELVFIVFLLFRALRPSPIQARRLGAGGGRNPRRAPPVLPPDQAAQVRAKGLKHGYDHQNPTPTPAAIGNFTIAHCPPRVVALGHPLGHAVLRVATTAFVLSGRFALRFVPVPWVDASWLVSRPACASGGS